MSNLASYKSKHPDAKPDEVYLGTLPFAARGSVHWRTVRYGATPVTQEGGKPDEYPMFVKKSEWGSDGIPQAERDLGGRL